MLAKVVDNNDPHGMGRIKAEFIGWGGEGKQTDWLRVLTPDAGGGGEKVAKNRGLVTVPEQGDQVYVDWEGGNPDRPFVTGSVFHGKHGGGGGTGNNSKSLTSKSGHTVMLDDGNGITVKDKAGNVVHIDGSGLIEIISSTKIKCKSADIEFECKNFKVTAETEINLSTQGTFTASAKGVAKMESTAGGAQVKAAQVAELNGDVQAQVIAPAVLVDGSGGTSIKGGVVEINC
jgi:uncharacterized protein involved in type VI secretion and phage assembly